MGLLFDDMFDVQKVSIQSTYNGAGGYTLTNIKNEISEGGLYTKELLKKRIIVMLGGKAAEYVYYGKELVTLGATQDLKEANKLARQMITQFGMGEDLEVFYEKNDDFSIMNDYSNYIKDKIDEESLSIVIKSYDEAIKLLKENDIVFKEIINKLIEKSILNQNELIEILNK